MTPHITLDNVSVYFGNMHALQHVSGVINKGSLTAVIGPNGGGKSTLLHTLKQDLFPTKGKIIYHELSCQDVSSLFQKNSIDPTFPITVYEVLGMGFVSRVGLYARFTEQDHACVNAALEKVGLIDQRNQLVQTLSSGQFQRMLFAQLWLQDKPIIFLDEPFSSIDEPTSTILMKLIQEWHLQGKTIVVVLHELNLARTYFPSTLLLAKSVIAWGKTENVMQKDILFEAFQL